ncbi:hypothetical protein GCM10008107_11150 [Psychrosphaera saromensis]|nr:hypothetical protein GCM10008107_11150 [Psychrosphaera saromensis]GLQ15618.1 hypothetical protein GCM10007917_30730 [Psychrosphaera saromensis]
MILELYAYAERPQLIDEIEQIVVSCLDNTSGCVELSPDHKKLYFFRNNR